MKKAFGRKKATYWLLCSITSLMLLVVGCSTYQSSGNNGASNHVTNSTVPVSPSAEPTVAIPINTLFLRTGQLVDKKIFSLDNNWYAALYLSDKKPNHNYITNAVFRLAIVKYYPNSKKWYSIWESKLTGEKNGSGGGMDIVGDQGWTALGVLSNGSVAVIAAQFNIPGADSVGVNDLVAQLAMDKVSIVDEITGIDGMLSLSSNAITISADESHYAEYVFHIQDDKVTEEMVSRSNIPLPSHANELKFIETSSGGIVAESNTNGSVPVGTPIGLFPDNVAAKDDLDSHKIDIFWSLNGPGGNGSVHTDMADRLPDNEISISPDKTGDYEVLITKNWTASDNISPTFVIHVTP